MGLSDRENPDLRELSLEEIFAKPDISATLAKLRLAPATMKTLCRHHKKFGGECDDTLVPVVSSRKIVASTSIRTAR
jgi:hypothetical protein